MKVRRDSGDRRRSESLRAKSTRTSMSFANPERPGWRSGRLLAELRYRRLPSLGDLSHCGAQFGTEPNSLELLAMPACPSDSPAVGENFWASAWR
jgi:hypothetical protein